VLSGFELVCLGIGFLEFRHLSRRNIAINVIPGKDKDIRLVGEDD
jgi:hypothetical protein